MKIKNQYEKLIAVVLTVSIIVTSFSSVVQISAQTDRALPNQAAQITISENDRIQTASRPAELTEEFTINGEDDFGKFMTSPELWESNYKVTLACDIDMKGKAFNSIKEFGGVFDGCGHTVSNIKIQNKSNKSKNSELSFINTLNEFAEIKNVTLDNYTIEGNSNIKKAAGFIITNHGTVSGVDIINSSINNIDKKAKVSGFVLNNEEDGIIENCFIGNMNDKNLKISSGFVGTNYGKITKCSTTLSVDSKDIAGGFCGSNLGEIIYCKSEGSVKAKASKEATICGGFVGENRGTIKDCSSTGAVEGQEFTGGFVGINSGNGDISSCKATCDVKSHTYIATINCGGFVGVDVGKIEDCSFEGKVDGCVDSEKVIGIAVGVTIGVILAIVVILFFARVSEHYDIMKKSRRNVNETIESLNDIVKNLIDNNTVSLSDNEQTRINSSLFTNYTKELNNAYEDNCKYMYILYKYIDIINEFNSIVNSVSSDENIFSDYKKTFIYTCYDVSNYYGVFNTLASFCKYNILSLFIAVPAISLIGGTASGVTARLTAGRKCANIGAFCGNNIGEISKCSANIDSLKAKSMYNKHNMCGGFVGTNGGTIKDSVATGDEICYKTYSGGFMGGFVGKNSGKIENGTTTISVANGKYTGGFCGNNSGEISGSRSEGSAKANAKTVETKCGGFVGENSGKVKDSCSIGSVTGQEYAGGFCGDNTGEISRCKAEGDAKASTKININRCGGFVGSNDEIGKISSCISTGSVTGEEYVGGFVGVNKSEISGCNATGKATSKTKANTALAGGFVGENEKGTVIRCTATGGVNSQSSSGQAKAGGFVGVNKTSIMDSKASGYVYLSAGTLYKDDGCGGFVGRNDQGGIIYGCYAECIVETTNKKKGGGFVGEKLNKSTISNSKCKTKIITKSGIRKQTKFCQIKDKKAVIENCYAN